MSRTQVPSKMLIIAAQLRQHLFRTDVSGVVVCQTLVSGDVADGVERCPTDLTCALGDLVCHRENLRRVLVQQQW